MRKNLNEHLSKILRLMPNNHIILEDKTLSKTVGSQKKQVKQIDDPKKATYVGVDVTSNEVIADEKLVTDFFNTLENLNKDLEEKPVGNIPYQKEVETMQIGLMLLGYNLPKFGVDGKFGPETAEAVKQFKNDQKLNESKSEGVISEVRIPSGCEGKLQAPTSKPTKFIGGPNISIRCTMPILVPELQDKILRVAERYGEPISLTSCYRIAGGAKCSQHFVHKAVDISLKNKSIENTLRFVEIASEEGLTGIGVYKEGSIHIDVRPNRSIWGVGFTSSGIPKWAKSTLTAHMSGQLGGGGYLTSDVKVKDEPKIKFTPEMGDVMSEKLKLKSITAQNIKKFLDPISVDPYGDKQFYASAGVNFTELNLNDENEIKIYEEICDRFISNYPPNPLGISGRIMSKVAAQVFQNRGVYIPPELALAQLLQEGGIGNPNRNIRPILTKNPFNVGNVDKPSNVAKTDSKYNVTHGSVESGIYSYYDLMARKYLKGRDPMDLLRNFVNLNGSRYATDPNYEKSLRRIVQKVSGISDLVMNKYKKDTDLA